NDPGRAAEPRPPVPLLAQAAGRMAQAAAVDAPGATHDATDATHDEAGVTPTGGVGPAPDPAS
ncbi:MAG: hypothetical protein ABIG85_07505, partial [Chloroflexota bacterium]